MIELRRSVAAGILGAILASGLALLIMSSSAPSYRAESEVAILPSATVPPDQVPDFWEALSRGQVARTSAEVLGQPQWLADAARTVGRPPSALSLTSGVIPDTTLIKLTLEADSAPVAERALRVVIERGSPLASLASGPFVLVTIQEPESTATPVGAVSGQLLPLAAVAGLLVGIGVALLISRGRSLMASFGIVERPGDAPSTPTQEPSGGQHAPSSSEETEPEPTPPNGFGATPDPTPRRRTKSLPLRLLGRSSGEGTQRTPRSDPSLASGAPGTHTEGESAPAPSSSEPRERTASDEGGQKRDHEEDATDEVEEPGGTAGRADEPAVRR
jgi:hypothetical protein